MLRQYAYFAIKSRELSANEIERRLGISADRVLVAGSESADPMRPAAHSWQLVCYRAGLTVDEQIANVVARLQPARAALRALRRRKVCRLFSRWCAISMMRPGKRRT